VLYLLTIAALLPLSLRDALQHLPRLTARLEPPPAQTEQLQLPLFRAVIRGDAPVRLRKNC
jgi:hypothetical protein